MNLLNRDSLSLICAPLRRSRLDVLQCRAERHLIYRCTRENLPCVRNWMNDTKFSGPLGGIFLYQPCVLKIPGFCSYSNVWVLMISTHPADRPEEGRSLTRAPSRVLYRRSRMSWYRSGDRGGRVCFLLWCPHMQKILTF